jgi:chromosome segregation ATPase
MKVAEKEIDKTEELKSNVEKAKKAWVQAKKKVDETRDEIDKYEAKKEQLTIELREAEDILSNSEEARHKALQLLAIGGITKAQFNEIKKKHEQTKAEMEDYTDMLDIVNNRIVNLGKELGEASNVAREQESLFWHSVTELLIEETLKNPIAIKACLSYHGFLRPGDFFNDRILRRLTEGEIKKMRDDLIEEYAK